MRQTLYVVLAALLILGCGGTGSSPTISNLKITTSPVERGKQASGQFQVSDPDGLGGLRGKVFFSGPGITSADMPIQNTSDSMTQAIVPFAFVLLQTTPTGTYTLKLVVYDGDGNESNALTTQFELK